MPAVYVAGSLNADLVVRAERHPRLGETVAGHDFSRYPGGKGANQALAAARLGAETWMIGKVGSDAFGDELSAYLAKSGVHVERVTRTDRAPTGVALVVVAESGENTVVVVPGANDLLTTLDVEGLFPSAGDVVLAQFEVPPAPIERLFEQARAGGATTMLNAAPARRYPRSLFELAEVILVNESELAFFSGNRALSTDSRESLAAAAERLRVRPTQIVVVTLGGAGVTALTPQGLIFIPARKVPVLDTTAAGDTFAGALAAHWHDGTPMERRLAYANAAAALCVQRAGAGSSIPTAEEVDATL